MTMSKWRGLAVAGSIAVVLTAVPGLARADTFGGAASFHPQSSKISRVVTATQMTKDDPVPSRGFSSPFMLADPTNPHVIVAATAELRSRVCYLSRSTDTGRTWHILPALPAPGAYPYCTNTVGGAVVAPLAWGRNGTLYYALNGYGNSDGGASRKSNISVLLARSTDLGNTWSTTLVDNTRGGTGTEVKNDIPVTGLAVDTSAPQDIVYVGFAQGHPAFPQTSAQGTDGSMVAVSKDGGRSFARPVDLNQFSHVSFSAGAQSYPLVLSTPFLAVSGKGVLVAVSGPRTPGNITIPGATLPEPVLVARSSDQGKTWSVSAMSPPVNTPRGPTLEDGVAWIPKGGPQGTFVTAYAAVAPPPPGPTATPGPADIMFQRSTDGGQTWSNPVRINDDDLAQQYLHFLPQLAVAPNGRISVAWYDFRQQHGFAPDVYSTYSTDAGLSWAPNVRVTGQSLNFSIGVSANSDIRQPPGIAAASQYSAYGWADTRLGNTDTQTQDDFGNVAQFSPLPASGSNTAPILAAIFGGLAAAGIILVLLLLRRRRKDPMPPVPRDRQPVGAG